MNIVNIIHIGDQTYRMDELSEEKRIEIGKKLNQQALEAIGATAERYAKEKTPVDTGRLQGSIAHAVRPSESAVYIGTNVEYGVYVELGARGRDPVHMLKKAATEHTDEYRHIAKTALGK